MATEVKKPTLSVVPDAKADEYALDLLISTITKVKKDTVEAT